MPEDLSRLTAAATTELEVLNTAVREAVFGPDRFTAWCKCNRTAGRRLQAFINSPTRAFRVAARASAKRRTNSATASASWASER